MSLLSRDIMCFVSMLWLMGRVKITRKARSPLRSTAKAQRRSHTRGILRSRKAGGGDGSARTIIAFILIQALSLAPATQWGYAGEPRDDEAKNPFKNNYVDKKPTRVVRAWVLPFATKNRKNLKTIRIVSVFEAKRLSYVRGHIHTGVDIVPRSKARKQIDVYPIADGIVCSIHLSDPHLTVVLRHILPDGKMLYTSYKHLGAVYVTLGEQVTINTRLARLYTREEARRLGGRYDHLHLEVRRSFDDYGRASWTTMTKKALHLRFIDPLIFLRKVL